MQQVKNAINLKTTINEFRDKYVEELQGEYSLEEIHSIFHMLTEAYLGMTRLQIALSPKKELNEEETLRFESALNRLKDHEPIQYILGEEEFFGMKFQVNEDVLIPRPETEELVEWVISEIRQQDQRGLRILDIGTGSGCIAVSLAKHLTGSKISSIDVSEKALAVAKRNAEINDVEVDFIQMNILEANQLSSTYDVIVSNPPYVRESEREEMRKNVLLKEPPQAIWVEDERPLLFYEKITELAAKSLSSNGSLYFEINEAFGKETLQLLTKNNFEARLKKDIFGKDRMAKGTLKS